MFDDSGSGWRNFEAHLETLQQALRDSQMDVARLAEQVKLQRKVIEKLVQFLADTGDAGDALLRDKEVRELLNLSPQPKPGAGKETGRTIGKLRCPACNSVVDDKEGIVDEKCPWCGEQLASAR